MPDIQQIFRDAASLEPADRLRLIARLWVSIPADHWAAPTARERADIEHRLGSRDFDAIADASWRIADRMRSHHDQPRSPKVYAAPRRFDLATIFVVTSAYALLYGGLALLMAPPLVSIVIAAFVTFVGVGQATLFGGQKPRAASMLVGVMINSVAWTGIWIANFRVYPAELILLAASFAVVGGVILGYCAGGLVAGVFLVADVVRRRFARRRSHVPRLDQDAADGG